MGGKREKFLARRDVRLEARIDEMMMMQLRETARTYDTTVSRLVRAFVGKALADIRDREISEAMIADDNPNYGDYV